jgi:O-antigen/teichoic acid export membrane protein
VTDAHFALMMSSIVFMLSGFANIMISIAQGYGRFDLANIAVLTVSAQNVIGISIVLYKGWGLRELVINVAIGWALSTIVGFALLSRSAPGFRFRSPRSARARVREAFAFGAPMQITNLMSALNQNIDKFLLSRFVALAALTPYELGFRVAVTAIGFPQLLMLAVMPTAAALHSAADLPRLRALYERGTRWILVATALTGAALIGSADRLYDTWIGPESGDAAWVLWGLTLSCSLAMAAGMASSVARGIARTDLEAWFHVTSGALHVALSFLLLPRIGLTGALIGSIAGNAAGAVVFLSALSSALGWSRASVLIAPNLAPFAAIALGALAGSWVDGRLPDPRMDLLGWLLVGVVAGISATVALAALLATRYVDLREVRAMLAGSPAAVPAPPAP